MQFNVVEFGGRGSEHLEVSVFVFGGCLFVQIGEEVYSMLVRELWDRWILGP